MSFMQYMNRYFIEETTLVDALNISRSTLLSHIKLAALPSHSYHIISNDWVETAVFGKLKIE
ncbi:MAG: hypothetical protein OFPI_18290 [Osedax symbiont Rs2]|nr:MAG: hypothetical protein OFPI_18290 [Osedax symbiont Rs2]